MTRLARRDVRGRGGGGPARERVRIGPRRAGTPGNPIITSISTDRDQAPSRLGNTANNWIGRSPSAGDPYLHGQVDDFRIDQRGLSAVEILDLFHARP